MKNIRLLLIAGILFFLSGILIGQENIPLDKWNYIQVDDQREKWGDFDNPEWLRYFGLDFFDVNNDGYQDILSGRYVYLNPRYDMTGEWQRIDFGFNVDGIIMLPVDNDNNADVIALALPDVFWLEADDISGKTWTARKIGQISRTSHVNSQGFRHAQLIEGGKDEILIAAQGGIYAASIPKAPQISANWKFTLIADSNSEEGIGVGDLDNDGDLDIAFGSRKSDENDPTDLYVAINPGNITTKWKTLLVANTKHAIDRVEIADFDGDKKNDIAVAEERFPGKKPDANIYWFKNNGFPEKNDFNSNKIYTGYSVNNLDAADLDKDGDIDLVSCEHKGKDYPLLVFENNGKGKFKLHKPEKNKESHLGTQLSDLDKDGDLDIVSIGWDNYKYLHLWRNDAIVREFTWNHLSSGKGDLPVPSNGKQQTASLVADLDKDGHMEVVVTERTHSPSVSWIRKVNGKWQKFIMDNDHLRIEAGSSYADIDNDGDLDVIFAGEGASNKVWWWENPYPDYEKNTPWKRRLIKNKGDNKHHDQIFGDFDGDGQKELVFWNQGAQTLFFSEIPDNPKETKAWEYKAIYTYSEDSEMQPVVGLFGYPDYPRVNEHEGLDTIDIDGDGLIDIVGGGRWFKYQNGKFIENIIDASYAFTRTAAGDLIEGERPEVLLILGDGTGPLYMYRWHEWEGWKGQEKGTGTWERRLILENFYHGHSVDIIDFNNDGHLDIFLGSMCFDDENCPDSKIMILLGDGKGNFQHHVITENCGMHEGKIKDIDGDGDYDIINKPYHWQAPRLDIWINTTEE